MSFKTIRDKLRTNSSMKIYERLNIKNSFPHLISFPRTGSHWLRILLEEYTSRPLLPRSFKFHIKQNYLLFHSHDLNLDLTPENVIYLYRSPVNVVYSQLNYYDQDVNDKNLIDFWTHQYACHLYHWHVESFTKKKMFIRYEEIQSDISGSFEKVCTHLNLNFDSDKFLITSDKITSERIKDLTGHDKKVISRKKDYEEIRSLFISNYKDQIDSMVANKIELF